MKVIQGHECEEEQLHCMKEEADDRLIFHIEHGCENGINAVLVYSPDSDVFINLLYHFKKSFTGIEYLYVKIGGLKNCTNTSPLSSYLSSADKLIACNTCPDCCRYHQ